MKDDLKLLIQLIDKNILISQISKIMNIPYVKIYEYLKLLKQNGYEILKTYYSNGDTKYELANEMFNDYTPRVITRHDEDVIDIMVYSDLHFGSFSETPKLLEKIYEYSVKKGIHIHFNVGDFIEGVNNPLNIKLPWYKQIDHALRVHPFCEDILVFLLLGNHDYSLIKNYGLNIGEVIKNTRGDIVPIGFGDGKIAIKNDWINLHHPLLDIDASLKENYSYSIILHGHSHEMKVIIDNSNYHIYAPSLSNLNFNNSHFPGAIDMKIKMRYGFIEYIELKEIAFIHNKLYITGRINLYTGRNKKFNENNIILNEEEYPKILRKGD